MATTHEDLITVGDWEMTVRTVRETSAGRYKMHVTLIRTDNQSRPDWSDADNTYDSREEAIEAARAWAEEHLK